MTALSDALEAAQSRAVSLLAKQYVAGQVQLTDVANALENMGLRDTVEREQWLNALGVIRSTGGEAPAETNGTAKEEPPATDAQLRFITKLLDEKGISPDSFPNKGPLTKAQAHEIIDSLQNGTYDPEKWAVPF